MRFMAPERTDLDAALFTHPVFDTLAQAHLALCRQPQWPEVAELNALWRAPKNRFGTPYRFVAQETLADGLHYEQRIFEHGLISTRSRNWHDLFNAFIWMRFPRIKAALNVRQCQDIAEVGAKQRTRSQCALTHFDEAGSVIRLSDDRLLAHWDEHDWPALFAGFNHALAGGDAQIWLFGHSIYEHALNPDIALVAKALVLVGDEAINDACMDDWLAERIAARGCCMDPQELRPIPLSGLAYWHACYGHADFYRSVPCFRPKRSGKSYPAPLHIK
ncbi:MAG: DUF3025 domain-containing protein [Arenimonas sp.]|nr:DUF3025 domain-containing protein [Arenimonas sp.]